MTKFVIAIVRLYQLFISPLSAPSCRFYPACSQYAVESLQEYGAVKGSYLALRRMLKCHPGNPGGYDPVISLSESNCLHKHHNSDKQNTL